MSNTLIVETASWCDFDSIEPDDWRIGLSHYTVVAVRKETSADGRHRHIAGVFTSDGSYYLRGTVVNSINGGDTWKTSCEGYSATIKAVTFCPKPSCYATPYIQTNPDSTKKDNLENLPER